MANRLRRVIFDDPSLQLFDWENTLVEVDDSEVRALAEALRGNNHVRAVSLGECTLLTEDAIEMLEAVLPSSAVESVELDQPGGYQPTQWRKRLRRLCVANVIERRIRGNDPSFTSGERASVSTLEHVRY